MQTTDLTLQAQAIFADDRYATLTTGIQIMRVDEHFSSCLMSIGPQHLNARKAVMGGALFTLADFAAAIAANTDQLSTNEPLSWVSLDSTIHFLSPAMAVDELAAECKALKKGNTTALYQTRISIPETGKVVALVESTMMKLTSH